MQAAVFSHAKEYDINLKLSQNASTCNNFDSLNIGKLRVSSADKELCVCLEILEYFLKS